MLKKRILPLCVSLFLLALLIWKVEPANILQTLKGLDPVSFGIAMALFIPQTWLIAWRWRYIATPLSEIPMKEATRQVLASNSLNLILPSKLGDMAKGVFLFRQGRCRLEDGLHIVVFEKLQDLAALAAWMLIGWVLAPRFDWWVLAVLGLGIFIIVVVQALYFFPREESWLAARIPQKLLARKPVAKIHGLLQSGPAVTRLIHGQGSRKLVIIIASMTIWLLHLVQIYFFFRSVESTYGFLEVMARMPIAIFAGLLPLTVAGVGVRDWAIVEIFKGPGHPPAMIATAALLVTLRYVVPAAGGLPFIPRYFAAGKEAVTARGRTPAGGPDGAA